MSEIKEVEPSEDLAYWVGVAQSDGCLTRYTIKDETRSQLGIGICSKSLPMLERFRDISIKIFDRHSYLWKTEGRDEWRFHIGIKRLLPLFRELGIILSPLFIPPVWTTQESKYFGAYLAGLIDGDGDIRIKRKKYPQCVIRLATGLKQDFLKSQLEILLKVFVSQTRRRRRVFVKSLGRVIEGRSVEVEFYVSKRTHKFLLDYVIPQIAIPHKRNKLLHFISENDAPTGI